MAETNESAENSSKVQGSKPSNPTTNTTTSPNSNNKTTHSHTLATVSTAASIPRPSSYDLQIAQVQEDIRNCKAELEIVQARADPLRDFVLKTGLTLQIPKSERQLRRLMEKRQTEWDEADYVVVSESDEKASKCVVM
ncbi:hypothetical protein EG327_001532 [Venturia inaequalis]|uniref:Uncharacterized protein n=1 Tax=Venturia inaequalis TaxID=5025 RepID=A0A8H3VK73_VENIN|nr:hypothetical protein EG327_001532 [Venturia inaequalis]